MLQNFFFSTGRVLRPLCFGFGLVFTNTLIADDTNWESKSSVSKICELLLKHPGMGILVSNNEVKLSTTSVYDPIVSFSDRDQALSFTLRGLPFRKELLNEVSSLKLLHWDFNDMAAIATFKIAGHGNIVSVLINRIGTIDLRIGASLDLTFDRDLQKKVISTLQGSGGEALLYAVYNILPPDPQDGVELWVTRLDGNNKKSRTALRDILSIVHPQMTKSPRSVDL